MKAFWSQIDGRQMYVTQRGSAEHPPVVLVHGLIVSSRYMTPLARALESEFNVYAPDLPGFGRSSNGKEVLDTAELGSFLAQWLSAMNLANVTIVANSYGCQIATEAALQAEPDRIAGMIFVGPTADPDASHPLRQIVRMLRGLPHEPVRYELVVLRDFVDCGVRRALKTFRHMVEHDVVTRASSVSVPVVIARGEHDHVCPQAWATRLAKVMNSGDVTVIERAAHDAHARFPEAVASMVKDMQR